ncbi:probable mediator of RNA polymerase II transcription subunit 37e [Chenopodium quinoa]|uniref:probable mediator of RNA polymerase II transcription subunit 37e n=1 Tax=Chenopodium quinoa TaxID=63459 RepID=UPI000B7918EF|nr:probable mediator of RNA polymerase II transcription subunit 37e [Chenopodium quinoa]
MVKDAEKFKVADKQYQEKVKAMNSLETYTQNMATMLECHGAKVGLRERRKMGVAINLTIQWLDQNLVLAEGCKFEEKMIELEGVCGPIIKKMLETQNSSTSSNGASGSRAKIEIIKLELD